MQSAFELSYPPKIVFGTGKLQMLPSLLPPAAEILLVTGRHAEENGLSAEITKMLSSFRVLTASGIHPEPLLSDVDMLIEIGRKERLTCVVAVGGGSVLDAAKAAAAIIPSEGCCADYFYDKRKIVSKGLFFAALPSTAGTGTEITKNSVLTDPVAKIKKSIRHQTMIPDLALIDPALTLSCPPSLSAASGMDALVQAIESYVSTNANAASRALARAAVASIYHTLPEVCIKPQDIALRSIMAEGSLLSAMAFSQSGLGAIHGLAHPIGALLNVPHGLTCTILLPHLLTWNAPVCHNEYRELAFACTDSPDADFTEAVSKLCRELSVPQGFREFKLSGEHFDFVLKNCRSNSMTTNPRPMADEDIIALLKQLANH
ncbi:MAG: hypothetical protein A2X49_16920 [Lentisphaerae bacterium GWF2_52_8]|nr:MAG: hypothetical protein A2X49_16920 [Lentisphaerae bacterium GWF2_52_8]